MGVFTFFKKQDLPKPNSSDSSNSDIKYLEKIFRQWLDSPNRKEQLLAEQYYSGDHDILRREKKVIGSDGKLVKIDNVANNKLVDNQYRKLVDQKTNYVLGKPLTIATENDDYLKELGEVFTKAVHRQFRVLARYAVDGGIAWLYPHYDEAGKWRLSVFPAYEICSKLRCFRPMKSARFGKTRDTPNWNVQCDTFQRKYSIKRVLFS